MLHDIFNDERRQLSGSSLVPHLLVCRLMANDFSLAIYFLLGIYNSLIGI